MLHVCFVFIIVVFLVSCGGMSGGPALLMEDAQSDDAKKSSSQVEKPDFRLNKEQ